MWSPARTTIVSADERSMMFRLRSTASAVPRYHSATRPREIYGCRSLMPPRFRSRSQGRPSPMWSFRECGLYWVRTRTSSMSELTQFDSEKSMIRYFPPKGTAGLARTEERIDRRSPSPPARISAIVRFTRGPSCIGSAAGGDRSTGSRRDQLTDDQRIVSADRPAGSSARQEQARVDEVAAQLDGPVEVRARRPSGVALVGDDLALVHVLALADLGRVPGVVDVAVPGHELR